jgi:alpha-L-fucosidase
MKIVFLFYSLKLTHFSNFKRLSKEFLSWLYSENSPVHDRVIVNDRWGTDSLCKHGGFLTCADKYNPRTLLDNRKWENAMTLELGSWGYRHNFELNDVITIENLITEIITTVSCGGNINGKFSVLKKKQYKLF